MVFGCRHAGERGLKDGIFPNWEDPDNRSGGCLSFKVTSIKVMNEWENLLLRCITDNILNESCDIYRKLLKLINKEL